MHWFLTSLRYTLVLRRRHLVGVRFLVFVWAGLNAGAVYASDTWLCEDENGHRYKVSQSVPVDSCRKLRPEQLEADPAGIELTRQAPRTWNIGRFCPTRRAGTCEVISDAVDFGKLNGVWFRLYANEATVSGDPELEQDNEPGLSWSVTCSRDKMSSVRSCMVVRRELYIFVSSNGKVSLSVGKDHFPGSQTSVKIGSRRFDTRNSDGYFANASALVSLLRDDAKVVTRYMEWPERYWVDDEFPAYGAATAVQVAQWLLKHGKLK